MCNRVTLRESPQDLAAILELLEIPPQQSRFNIAPTQDLLILRRDTSGNPEACMARWGLVPPYAKQLDAGLSLFNARSETAATKPAFRHAFKERRCLIPVDGFYEWEKKARRRLPFHITLKDKKPFCLAGLYEVATIYDQPVESATILTTCANELVGRLHDRMPVIIAPGNFRRWLDPNLKTYDELKDLLQPFPASEMLATPVNTYVNNSQNEGAQCLAAPEPEKVEKTLWDL